MAAGRERVFVGVVVVRWVEVEGGLKKVLCWRGLVWHEVIGVVELGSEYSGSVVHVEVVLVVAHFYIR